jgi:hypothetical protein
MEKPVEIICPHCHQPSYNIKRLQIWSIIFLFFAAARQTRTITACAGCMRREIAMNGAINILTANILFPFIILPMSVYQFWRTYEEGHDESILAEIRALSRPSNLSKLGKL